MKFYVKSKLSENISVTPEGFLLCKNVPLTHTGPLVYTKGEHPFDEVDGDMTITRTKDELHSPATIASFVGKPLTIQHPKDFVTPDNWKELSNGILMNVRPSSEQIEVEGKMEDTLLSDILVTGREAINMVNEGMREVSLGYDALWVQTGDNTAEHTKIRGNHCALVDSGRAGINCAIQDSKGEEEMDVKLRERFAKLMGKTVDEAMEEKEKEKKSKDEDKKEEKKDESKDADEEKKDDKKDDKKEEKKDESKDEGEEESSSEGGAMEERLSKLEAMVAEIVQALQGDSEEVVADDSEEEESSEDEDMEGMDEDDKEKEGKAGDTMSRAEILAPGIKKSSDVKMKALTQFSKTTDGKKVLNMLSGGKKLSEIKNIDTIFVAASEMMKKDRVSDFASKRSVSIDQFPALKQKGAMTADDINKINAERYGKK